MYLDKGLVLYDSLCDCAKDFKLYVLCMDDKCYEVLTDLKQEHHIPVRLADFEASDEDLLVAKGNRSFGEYCWTCSSSFILYILERYREPICTYIDADMFFYKDPEFLIDEMRNASKTVIITPHRFSPEHYKNVVNGIYCVEFNTFVNEESSLNVLKKWKKDCLDCCTAINDGIHFGDQKYIDNWPQDYPDIVHICQHPGAGIAPWNIEWYQDYDKKNNSVYYKKEGEIFPVVYYHFHHLMYVSKNVVKTHIPKNRRSVDYKLVDQIYIDYLKKIEIVKQYLENRYDINYCITEHPAMKSKNSWKTALKQLSLISWLCRKLYPYKYFEEYNLSFQ